MVTAEYVGDKVILTYKGPIHNPIWATSDGVSIISVQGHQCAVPVGGRMVGPASNMDELCRQAPQFFKA